jgi:hypothetical protein
MKSVPCCGLHFGYEDFYPGRADLRAAFYHGWRVKWHLDGMRWWSETPPPHGWDAEAQFGSIREEPFPLP